MRLVIQSTPAPWLPSSEGTTCHQGRCVGRWGICTHGHSRAGFRSRSGWGGRSWWWSPEAGNLSDSGRALCFPPVVRMEGPTITFHAAALHTRHSVTHFPMTQLLLPPLPLPAVLFPFSWLDLTCPSRQLILFLSYMGSPNTLINALMGRPYSAAVGSAGLRIGGADLSRSQFWLLLSDSCVKRPTLQSP